MKSPSARLIFSLLLIVFATKTSAQNDAFPSYETVLIRFFSSYSVDSLELGVTNLLHFAKKPAGWSIQVEDIASKKLSWINLSGIIHQNYGDR